jgi:hypothetical protein
LPPDTELIALPVRRDAGIDADPHAVDRNSNRHSGNISERSHARECFTPDAHALFARALAEQAHD